MQIIISPNRFYINILSVYVRYKSYGWNWPISWPLAHFRNSYSLSTSWIPLFEKHASDMRAFLGCFHEFHLFPEALFLETVTFPSQHHFYSIYSWKLVFAFYFENYWNRKGYCFAMSLKYSFNISHFYWELSIHHIFLTYQWSC